MADVGIFTKNADILARVGANANATAKATAATDVYVLNVESTINALTRFNWSDWYADVVDVASVDIKGILTETGASMCAINVINWDMDAIGRSVAESMITVLRDIVLRNLQILKNTNVQTFMDEEA